MSMSKYPFDPSKWKWWEKAYFWIILLPYIKFMDWWNNK